MNQLPPLHELIAQVLQCARALEKKGDRVFGGSGLTTQYFHVLFLIAEAEGPIFASTLADELVTTRSNLTGILSRMEKAGLIRRKAVPQDRRSAELSLTPAGRTTYQHAAAAYRTHLDELGRTLPARSVAATLETLRQLTLLTQ